jgi:hypothetical protein
VQRGRARREAAKEVPQLRVHDVLQDEGPQGGDGDVLLLGAAQDAPRAGRVKQQATHRAECIEATVLAAAAAGGGARRRRRLRPCAVERDTAERPDVPQLARIRAATAVAAAAALQSRGLQYGQQLPGL